MCIYPGRLCQYMFIVGEGWCGCLGVVYLDVEYL